MKHRYNLAISRIRASTSRLRGRKQAAGSAVPPALCCRPRQPSSEVRISEKAHLFLSLAPRYVSAQYLIDASLPAASLVAEGFHHIRVKPQRLIDLPLRLEGPATALTDVRRRPGSEYLLDDIQSGGRASYLLPRPLRIVVIRPGGRVVLSPAHTTSLLFCSVRLAKADDVHGVVPRGDNGDVRPAVQRREHAHSPLAIVAARVLQGECCEPVEFGHKLEGKAALRDVPIILGGIERNPQYNLALQQKMASIKIY